MTAFRPFRELPREEQRRNNENYVEAKNSRAKFYEGYCGDHGWHEFFADTKKCTACGKRLGRPYSKGARATARRNGELKYTAVCEIHGPTLHHVQANKCATCFTAGGVRRSQPALRDAARADARNAGLSTYPGTCGTHGRALHSVTHGKCLECFTTTGAIRKPRRSFVL